MPVFIFPWPDLLPLARRGVNLVFQDGYWTIRETGNENISTCLFGNKLQGVGCLFRTRQFLFARLPVFTGVFKHRKISIHRESCHDIVMVI